MKLFVSDIHLSPAFPAITGLFLRFLEKEASRAEALYILGDLFEVWLGDDAIEPWHFPILEAIRKVTEGGTKVYLMPGNRDFLMGEALCRRLGAQDLPDPFLADLGGPTLLMHGDSLCTDDEAYQAFRAQVREPSWQKTFLALPVQERRRLAEAARATSREYTRSTPEAILDVNPETVRETFEAFGVTSLIHGHTHRPGIHTSGKKRRIVLGDWGERGSVLRLSDTFELSPWP